MKLALKECGRRDSMVLGFRSHAAFHARYGRALAASRGSKAGSPEAQAGLLAMEGLHKQAGIAEVIVASLFT